MMKCKKCKEKAVILHPQYCKEHFIKYFENKVKKEIKKQDIKGKICVACSGGKDSTTVLYILKKFGLKVEALAIDEGIKNYRDESLEFLKNFCKKNKIKLNIKSFKELTGKTLDQIVKVKKHSCKYCGVLRRYLLNENAKNYDMIATGHNLDDESQAALMNLITGRKELLPSKTKKVKGLVKRIKPLRNTTEKEVMTYTYLKKFPIDFKECPNLKNSQRQKIRDILNKLESQKKGTKQNILKKYSKIKIEKEKKGFINENALKIINEVKNLKKPKKCQAR